MLKQCEGCVELKRGKDALFRCSKFGLFIDDCGSYSCCNNSIMTTENIFGERVDSEDVTNFGDKYRAFEKLFDVDGVREQIIVNTAVDLDDVKRLKAILDSGTVYLDFQQGSSDENFIGNLCCEFMRSLYKRMKEIKWPT